MLSPDPCFSLIPVYLDLAPIGYTISSICYRSDGEKVSIAASLLCMPILADPICTHSFPISACLTGSSVSSAWFQPESCPAQHKHWRCQVCSTHIGKSKLFMLLLLLLYLSSFTPRHLPELGRLQRVWMAHKAKSMWDQPLRWWSVHITRIHTVATSISLSEGFLWSPGTTLLTLWEAGSIRELIVCCIIPQQPALSDWPTVGFLRDATLTPRAPSGIQLYS